jgi:lipopolysaccharide/colanic/teichoic acid biosynthesis glycosyltransferase
MTGTEASLHVPEAALLARFEYRFLKRALDALVSLALLIGLAPLFGFIALLVKASSPGPVFYRWTVAGLGGRPFIGYKFRSMVADADLLKPRLLGRNEMDGPVFKITGDPRITAVGQYLRKFSLDELPQLWSVLKGDMSLVGPRPPLLSEWEAFEPWQRRKLSVRPGLTCLWQVRGRNSIRDFDRWVEMDLHYVDNWSLGLDLKILFLTIPAIVSGSGR